VLSRSLCRDGACLCVDSGPLEALEVTGQILAVVDRRRRVLYLSPVARERLGIPEPVGLGIPWSEVFRPLLPTREDLRSREADREACVMDVQGWDGVVLRLLRSGRVLRDRDGEAVGAVEVYQDVGHLSLEEAGRKISESRSDCMALGPGEPVEPRASILADGQGRIVSLSDAAVRRFGLSPDLWVGGPLSRWLQGGFPRISRAIDAVRRTGCHAEVPDVLLRTGGPGAAAERVTVRVFPALDPDRRGHVLCILETSSEGPEARFGIVAESPAMRRLVQRVVSLASQDVPVLIEGESGVGKELVARALHLAGTRASRPFQGVNCASLHEELLENDLFGHERGAFTGATGRKPGRMEVCGEGTLLLDEVGCLSSRIQAKLLRVLESREFERLGGTRSIPFRARLVAATNADLARLVQQGEFRQDLYYRLCVVPIRVPPLRERREDILPLARHFLQQGIARPSAPDVPVPVLSREAESALWSCDWPGNVRQLRNAIQYALSLVEGKEIRLEHLPPEVTGAGNRVDAGPDLDRERVEEVLRLCRYRQGEAARRLGVSRTTLWRMRKRLGLGPGDSD